MNDLIVHMNKSIQSINQQLNLTKIERKEDEVEGFITFIKEKKQEGWEKRKERRRIHRK